jgi:hypothetical protein
MPRGPPGELIDFMICTMPRRWDRTALRQLPLFDQQQDARAKQAARSKAEKAARIKSLAEELRRRLEAASNQPSTRR